MKRTMKVIAALAFGLVLASGAEARTGGKSMGPVFASEGAFSLSSSASASLFTASTFRKNQIADGQVIVMEAWGQLSTTGTPTLTVGASLGATTMISTGAMTQGSAVSNEPFRVKAVGTVRTVTSGSTSSPTAGTILWVITFQLDGGTDILKTVVDTTADNLDTRIDNQNLGLVFTWGTSSASNALTIESFQAWVY